MQAAPLPCSTHFSLTNCVGQVVLIVPVIQTKKQTPQDPSPAHIQGKKGPKWGGKP